MLDKTPVPMFVDNPEALRDELEILRGERNKYRRMVDCLYDRMVKMSPRGYEPEELAKYNDISKDHVTIMNPDGEFVYVGRLNRIEAERIWRTMWGLEHQGFQAT